MRILGLDPGLRNTGWGVIETRDQTHSVIGFGVIKSGPPSASLSQRLKLLFQGLKNIIQEFSPAEAAVEETFVNNNPKSTLKLGMARGVILVAPALENLPVGEYAPNLIKKTLVGAGHADKVQITQMLKFLFPTADLSAVTPDAADALAVALCHAHHRESQVYLNQAIASKGTPT